MCGRFAQGDIPAALRRKIQNLIDEVEAETRYNIAPTASAIAVIQEPDETPSVQSLHWGLVPFWADDPSIGSRLINARAETIDTKPSFRDAFHKRRCLIPTLGFYEWRKDGVRKTPYFFTAVDDDQPVVLAGLWEDWRKDGKSLRSFTIVTTEANAQMRPIHDRMPVILKPDDWKRWLNPSESSRLFLDGLLKPADDEVLTHWEVSSYVNNAVNQGKHCIEPVESIGI